MAVVPSRPSAGGWFTSRRFEGAEDLPRTPAAGGDSPTSVGAGCAPTPSPDLLAFRAGRRANAAAASATAAAAASSSVSDAARRRQGFGDSSVPPSTARAGRGADGMASEEGVTGSTAARLSGVWSELGSAPVGGGGGEGSEVERCWRERQSGKRKRGGKRGANPVIELEPNKRGGKIAAGGNGDPGE